MAHPYASVKQDKVERSRVSKMTQGCASGGSVHSDAAQDRKMVKSMVKSSALKMEGAKSGGRLDKYARGGAVKKASTNVNVIIAPQGGAGGAPMPVPPVGGPAVPPAAGPPPMPPGMPVQQKNGGRTRYAAGGKVGDGPAWREGLRNATPVQHADGKNDAGNIHRGRQVTFSTGGPVEANKAGPKMTAGSESGEGRLQKTALQKRKG